eukprot:3043094-Amphidinium_carterae.1
MARRGAFMDVIKYVGEIEIDITETVWSSGRAPKGLDVYLRQVVEGGDVARQPSIETMLPLIPPPGLQLAEEELRTPKKDDVTQKLDQ